MFHVSSSWPEPVHFFWGMVVLLALAAACNHGWHHARESHLAMRLARATYRDGEARPGREPYRRLGDLDR